MIFDLTSELFQSYSNESESLRVEILYNNSFNFFYCEIFLNDVLVQGSTRIVNNYENEYLKFISLTADFASFLEVENFKIEVKDVI